MSCEECVGIHEQLGSTPPCQSCGKPVLLPENIEAWEIYQVVASQIIMSMGVIIGISIPAIVNVLNIFKVRNKMDTLLKVLLIHDTMYENIRKKQREESQKIEKKSRKYGRH